MSDSKADRSKLLAYVQQTLQLDPERDSEAIIAARIQALGLSDPAITLSTAHAAAGQLRRAAIEELRQVREGFWALPIDTLDARLGGLMETAAPHLQAAVLRLQIVAANRQRFLELVTSKAESSFANILRDVFVMEPREAATLKEAIRQAFRRPFWRRSRRVFVQRLRRELPALYQIEAAWFDTVLGERPRIFLPRRQTLPARLFASPP
jgi:hypothetical protein